MHATSGYFSTFISDLVTDSQPFNLLSSPAMHVPFPNLPSIDLKINPVGTFSCLVPCHENATLRQYSLGSSLDEPTSFCLQPSFMREPSVHALAHSLFPYILFLSDLCPAFCILTLVKSCLQEAFFHSLISVIPHFMFLFSSYHPIFPGFLLSGPDILYQVSLEDPLDPPSLKFWYPPQPHLQFLFSSLHIFLLNNIPWQLHAQLNTDYINSAVSSAADSFIHQPGRNLHLDISLALETQ